MNIKYTPIMFDKWSVSINPFSTEFIDLKNYIFGDIGNLFLRTYTLV